VSSSSSLILDIGFARSLDAGRSWKWWSLEGRAPWTNTCYELAFDPTTTGKMWGAFSNVHDIPNANIIMGQHRAAGPAQGTSAAKTGRACWADSTCGMPVTGDGDEP